MALQNPGPSLDCSEVFRKPTKFYHRAPEDSAAVSSKLDSLCDPLRRSCKVVNQATHLRDYRSNNISKYIFQTMVDFPPTGAYSQHFKCLLSHSAQMLLHHQLQSLSSEIMDLHTDEWTILKGLPL